MNEGLLMDVSECVFDDHDFDPTYDWTLDPEVGVDGDPDKSSLRMRHYHQHLWSQRPMAGGAGERGLRLGGAEYGLLDSALGDDFFGNGEGLYLASDRAIATWWNWSTEASIQALLADSGLRTRVLQANRVLDNMGGIVMWPRRAINGPSINQARGFDRKATIADRLDLTLECVRRYYGGVLDDMSNPLGADFLRYQRFFELFGDFEGFVDFWLLQDLVTDDGEGVLLFLGTESGAYDFAASSPFPASVTEYDEYLNNAQVFVLERNARLSALWDSLRID